jgi:hypothetical protein
MIIILTLISNNIYLRFSIVEHIFFEFLVYQIECDMDRYLMYFQGSMIMDVEAKELHDRMLTINLNRLLKNPNENFEKCIYYINEIQTYKYFKDSEQKHYLVLMFNNLYHNQHYTYAIRAYMELLKFGDYADLFDRFYYKIIEEGRLDQFNDVLEINGDENVLFLKSLIRFAAYINSNVRLSNSRIMTM